MFDILRNVVTEAPVVRLENTGERNALIVDACGILHSMKGSWKTFSDFADATFALLRLACQSKAARLDFVADMYPEISIKNTERSRRAAQGVQIIHILNKNQNVPKQWRQFMSSGENKESLVAFLLEYWSTYETSKLNKLECMYITTKDKCYVLVPGSSPQAILLHQKVRELESNHEEADTRLLLHSKHASFSHDRIMVKCSDTDVLVLCIANQTNIGKPLYFITDTANKRCIIDVSAISHALGEDLCNCLPGFHAFSGKYYINLLYMLRTPPVSLITYRFLGCDSTSAFLGKGKAQLWKILNDYPEFKESFRKLGESFPVSQDLVTALNRFVCLLCGNMTSKDVDDCRYRLFISGKYGSDSSVSQTLMDLFHAASTRRAKSTRHAWKRRANPGLYFHAGVHAACQFHAPISPLISSLNQLVHELVLELACPRGIP